MARPARPTAAAVDIVSVVIRKEGAKNLLSHYGKSWGHFVIGEFPCRIEKASINIEAKIIERIST